MILVFARDGPTPEGQAPSSYRNHYLARRQVSSEGWTGAEVPSSKLAHWFGETSFGQGFNQLSEGMFFVGRLVIAWKELKDEGKLDPIKHYVEIERIEGCRFPEKLFRMRGFREMVDGFAK
jgi:hypothetical protein